MVKIDFSLSPLSSFSKAIEFPFPGERSGGIFTFLVSRVVARFIHIYSSPQFETCHRSDIQIDVKFTNE
jgi:hypothetical protein